MQKLDYFVVDCFTELALAGNPLAVVLNTVALSTVRMQAIALEFNLSETAFVERRPAVVERSEGVRVRIFTAREELPFAGHPTLGTAGVLKKFAPDTLRGDAVTLALNVGPVPVRFETKGNTDAVFGEMIQRDPEFGMELDRAEVARLTGLSENDLDPAAPPQVVSTGTGFAIVVLRSTEPLARLKVRQEEAMAWLRPQGARWFYVLAPAPDGKEDHSQGHHGPDYRARMQFNGGEDPATGSAAGCAISYLAERGIVASGERIHVRQGVEMGRPSDLFLSARSESGRVTDVRVAGSTVLVATGQLFLP